MAKKKGSRNQENSTAAKEMLHQEKPLETMEDPSEKLKNKNLKSLNDKLIKETFERREQVDLLQKSNENLESEISRFTVENQRLEAEKKILEERVMAAEIQHNITLVSVTEEFNQKQNTLEEQMRKEQEELQGQVEEKIREISKVSNEFSTYRDEVRKDLEMKEKEEDRLRSLMKDVENNNVEIQKEIKRMRVERDVAVEKKAAVEISFAKLEREMTDVVRERILLDQVKNDREVEIKKLQKAVDLLNGELGRERGVSEGVLRERDVVQKNLDIQVKETESLISKLLELEKSRLGIMEKLSEVEIERERLVEERKESGKTLEALVREKDSITRSLVDFLKLIDDLKREKKEIVREKEVVEKEKTKQGMKIAELQKEGDGLRSTISALQKNEEDLQSKIAEMGKNYTEALEKQELLKVELGTAIEERREKQKSYELLMGEKDSLSRNLEEALSKLGDQTRKIQEIGEEKAEIEQAKFKLETEIEELHKELSSLRVSLSTVQDSYKDQMATNKQLQSEVGNMKDNLERVTLERNDVQKELDLMKEKESSLRLKVMELEKNFEKTLKVLEKTLKDFEQQGKRCLSISVEMKELERSSKLLIDEKSSLQRRLVEAKELNRSLIVKMKSAEMNSERAFLMLKDASELVCGSEDEDKDGIVESEIDKEKIEEEIRPFASELAAIRRAFKNKERKLEEMTRQIGDLNKSVVDAKKNKNLWAWISSATTILVAATAATSYVARGR